MKLKHYDIYNIVWDKEIDGVEQDVQLPSATTAAVYSDEDAEEVIGDYLSDKYGFCVYSFEYELISEPIGYILHFRQTVDGIETETPRYWRSNADNYEHAVEQLKDHIERELGEKVIFVELIGTKK
jgi:hypothetical protein